ncbi:MAG TPA: HEAT repeat domain-containing protein [Pyrinomonadaceae bacterium]|jgi:hypothetical protein
MTGTNSNGSSSSNTALPGGPATAPGRRTPWPFIILALLFVIVPFFTWYGTWFGGTLSDEKLDQYLSDDKNLRHVQNALAQIEGRIEKGDESVKRWYPQVVALAGNPNTEIRRMAAWVMGQDNKSEEFHAALARLLEDSQPSIRRNAAVQLVRFNDSRGRPELRAMLRPYELVSPVEGTINSILGVGETVREGSLIVRLEGAGNRLEELRAPLPGKLGKIKVSQGAKVAPGDPVLEILPDADFVYESLRALYFAGEAEDLADVERYAQGPEGMPDRVKQQAAQTAKAIRGRSENKNGSAIKQQ